METFPVFGENGEIQYLLEHIHLAPQVCSQPRQQGLVGRSAAFNRMIWSATTGGA